MTINTDEKKTYILVVKWTLFLFIWDYVVFIVK